MKTLRSKIFVFVSLLLILPALPLSYFVLELLEQSYHIGVNESVESALDGALNISADLYQMHKLYLQSLLTLIAEQNQISSEEIVQKISANLQDVQYKLTSIDKIDQLSPAFSAQVIETFLKNRKKNIIWSSPDHKELYALARIEGDGLLQILYPLSKSFQNSASQIQEVNQIYKTLNFARTDIRKSFLLTFLSIYGIGSICALYFLYKITKRITKPIEQLTAATKEIGTGNLDYRINYAGHDEFSMLASSLNSMVEELSENQQKILELEKMATWQQLARRLAHEIKNPLTPIQLMAQQMKDSYNGENTEYKKILEQCHEIIDEEIESLKKLVREFSDFARLPEFQIEKHCIKPLIETLQKLYHQNNFVIELADPEIEFNYDMDYLKRAFINLIDNAIAASKSNTGVLLQVENMSKAVVIKIVDTGEGISEQNMKKIFEPYYSTKRTGVGLGLPIVKKIIEEHNGVLTVCSEINKGTTFTITIPIE